jgi:hypothetical protein
MKRYVVAVVVCLLAVTVALSLGFGVKPVEVPPPIGLAGEAGGRAGEGAGEPRTRASGAAAQRGARVRGDRRRSRPRPAGSMRGPRQDRARRAMRRARDTDHHQADRDDAADESDD